MEDHAEPGCDGREPVGQRPHAAGHDPDAILLDMGDEHQRCGCGKGRGSAIGGITAEQLAQARIGKIAAKRRPERGKRLHRQKCIRPVQSHPKRQRQRIGPRRIDEAVLGDRKDPRGRQSGSPRGKPSASALPQSPRWPVALLDIAMKIKPRAALPVKAGDDIGAHKAHLVGEAGAAAREQRIEEPRPWSATVGPESKSAPPAATGRSLPPGPSAASMTTTRCPAAASAMAAASPPMPAPKTATVLSAVSVTIDPPGALTFDRLVSIYVYTKTRQCEFTFGARREVSHGFA